MAYQDKTKEKFQNIPEEVKEPTTEDFKIKHQTLLTDIGGEWFIDIPNNPKPTIKKPRLTKKEKNKKNPRKIESGM